MKEEKMDRPKLIIYLIVLVAVLGALLNIPSYITDLVIQWLVSAFVGSVFSLVAGAIVEAFTGNFLKTMTLNISIKGFQFPITVFAIATFILKVALFGL